MEKETIKKESVELLDLSALSTLRGGKEIEKQVEAGHCFGLGCKCSEPVKKE